MLARLRSAIFEADPGIAEAVNYASRATRSGVPVWERGGGICTGDIYKDKVKLTFAQGSALPDPAGLFNASLDAGTRRAIDIREGEQVDLPALKYLVRSAIALNLSKRR